MKTGFISPAAIVAKGVALALAATLSSCSGTAGGLAILRANRLLEADRAHEAAAIYLEQGVDSWHGVVAYDLANTFLRLGEYGSAESLFLSAGETGSASVARAAWFNLGVARLERGLPEEAALAFRKALEAAPGDREAAKAYELALKAIPESGGAGAAERARADAGGDSGEAGFFNLTREDERSLFSSGSSGQPAAVDH